MSDEYPDPQHEHPALEGLRAERAEKWAALQLAGGRGVDLANAIDELDERIEAIGTGAIRCRNCGGERLVAWYPEYARQGIELTYDGAGGVDHDYTGEDYDHADEAGTDDEYWCLECEAHSRDLAYLVGVKLVEEFTYSDDGALRAIAELLDRREWQGADDLDAIAAIVRATGREIREPIVHAIDCDMGEDCTCEANDDERG